MNRKWLLMYAVFCTIYGSEYRPHKWKFIFQFQPHFFDQKMVFFVFFDELLHFEVLRICNETPCIVTIVQNNRNKMRHWNELFFAFNPCRQNAGVCWSVMVGKHHVCSVFKVTLLFEMDLFFVHYSLKYKTRKLRHRLNP